MLQEKSIKKLVGSVHRVFLRSALREFTQSLYRAYYERSETTEEGMDPDGYDEFIPTDDPDPNNITNPDYNAEAQQRLIMQSQALTNQRDSSPTYATIQKPLDPKKLKETSIMNQSIAMGNKTSNMNTSKVFKPNQSQNRKIENQKTDFDRDEDASGFTGVVEK
jgi:hypothetical protein